MSITLTINGTDRSSLIDWQSLQRDKILTKEADTMSFLIKKYDSQTYKPTLGHEVVFTVNSVKEFGGYIIEMNETIIGRLEYIEVSCKDYTHALDRQLVSKTYTSQSVNDIISNLVSTFSTGFTVTNVVCPVVIDKVQFNYLPISKCIEKLTDLVGNFDWYVDYDKDIHFFATASNPSTFDITDTSGNYVFNSLEINEDTSQLRNEVIIRGGTLTSASTRTELLSGDGTKVIFPLATKFSTTPTITVGGVGKTVGIANIDTTGFDVYWDYNQKSLRFTSAPASSANNISVVATYEYPLILQKRNESSVSTYGLFQNVIVDKTLKDLETAGLRADVELIKYSVPAKTARFRTYTNGLLTGQTINISSTIRGLNDDYRIKTIKSKLKTPDTGDFIHNIECVTAESLTMNDVLAKLLIKNPSDQLDLSSDEVIARIRQFTDTFGFTDSIATPVKTSPPYYVGSTAIMGFFTMG